MDLLNIWESRLSPRPQLLALLWAPPPGASAGDSSPSFLPQPMNATKYGNMTQDHVMHLLLVSGARPGNPTSHPIPTGPGPAHSRRSTWAPQISEATQMWPLMFYEVPAPLLPTFLFEVEKLGPRVWK